MRRCTACSTTTDESGRFCPECGSALVDPRASTALPQEAEGPSSTASQLIGKTIDRMFVIDGVLGGGSFGTVYHGRQLGLDRAVAVKVPTFEIASDPIMVRRFQREARSAARIQHPSVVAIYGIGELDDGRPYLAMQLVEGEPLDQILVDGPLPAVRALGIARAIASALSETHAAEVVHRDLKPSNIMWRRDRNGDDRITLVDFGIAVCKPGNADATRLTSGGLIGTPHYMSPEQAHGEIVDARADLYALGCLLFELVTGAPPFEGSGFEVLLAHLGRPAPVPSSNNPDVPEQIDRICAALLHKKPDDRPASADELVAMIDRALGELGGSSVSPAIAETAPRLPRSKRPSVRPTQREVPEGTRLRGRRSRRWLVGGAMTAAALATAGFVFFHFDRGADADADEPDDTPNGPVDPHGAHRHEVFQDDGEIVLHALIPDPIAARQPVRPHLELKNKLGQPITTAELVVTITDPAGKATGMTARAHGDHVGHYAFRYTFPQPGHYLLRVFPPSVDSSFELPLDVVP